jgi:D-threo-aldose 1-dehydrogenase
LDCPSKVSKTAKNKEYFPFSPSPNDVVYDYTASGVQRSIEDSLQRLGIDSIDITFVHDISSDYNYGKESIRSRRHPLRKAGN